MFKKQGNTVAIICRKYVYVFGKSQRINLQMRTFGINDLINSQGHLIKGQYTMINYILAIIRKLILKIPFY